jgi:hypothetical protein
VIDVEIALQGTAAPDPALNDALNPDAEGDAGAEIREAIDTANRETESLSPGYEEPTQELRRLDRSP